MILLLLATCCSLLLAADERARFGGYQEEIVFPERLNASFHPSGRDEEGMLDNSLDTGGSPGERLSFRFRAFGEEFILGLEKDPSFVSGDLTVQYLGRSGQAVESPTEQGNYFTGTVNFDPESIVAVNYDGVSLLGVLQYRGTEYHLQPLEGGVPNTAGGAGAHVVRKKTPEKVDGPMCGVGAPTPEGTPALAAEPLVVPENPPKRAKVGANWVVGFDDTVDHLSGWSCSVHAQCGRWPETPFPGRKEQGLFGSVGDVD